jgi:hypothetical protein
MLSICLILIRSSQSFIPKLIWIDEE